MSNTVVRRAVTCCGLMAIAVATVTGCSSDDKSSGAGSSSAAPSSSAAASAAQADPAATKAITDAYVLFFDGKASPDQKAAVVEKGSVFAPVLQAQAANPQAQSTSVTVASVKLIDADHADVGYTLLMGGNPVLPDQTGQAIKENGKWEVAASTFCALMMLQGGTSPAC